MPEEQTIEKLDAVIIEPASKANASIIWLHGLGADGHDFEAIVPQLRLPESLAVRFIFPHAPTMPVTVNGGYVMRAWYDILTADIDAQQDEQGIRKSASQIEQLIEYEKQQGIAANRIILAGFSQGGVIALHTGLRHPQTLAGLLALSCYLPLQQSINAERHASNMTTEIFMAHGDSDSIIPLTTAQQSHEMLKTLGNPVSWHEYPMEHGVSVEEIQDIADWIKRVLQAETD